MESVFSRFDSYNFEADQRFVDGLKALNRSDGSREESELLNLKLFFYNRFVEPIDRSSYKQRSSSSHHVVEHREQRTLSLSDSDAYEKPATETHAHPETTQLSFAEVMRLVREGKEVPGVTKVDIQPSNLSPTSSQMQRPLKPWES